MHIKDPSISGIGLSKLSFLLLKTDQKESKQACTNVTRREEVEKATGGHYNLPGHKLSDMSISVLESVKEKNTYYRECRESYHIENFNLYKGKESSKRGENLLIAIFF